MSETLGGVPERNVIFSEKQSSLRPNAEGLLKLKLLQIPSGQVGIGRKDGLKFAQRRDPNRKAEFEGLLDNTVGNSLNVISFHPGVDEQALMDHSRRFGKTIVTLAGYATKENGNESYISLPGELIKQKKLSFESEEQSLDLSAGNEIFIFGGNENEAALKWVVLNCHDYSHVDLIKSLLLDREKKVRGLELIIVLAHNAASRLYWQYALADAHRLFCFVVIVNVGDLGGSGVFAPFRRIGKEKGYEYRSAGELFTTRGPGNIVADIDLDIGALRDLRRFYRDEGLSAFAEPEGKDGLSSGFSPIYPSQHFMKTKVACRDTGAEVGEDAGAPEFDVDDKDFAENLDKIKIGIVQLKPMGVAEYVEAGYRLDRNTDPQSGIGSYRRNIDAYLALAAEMDLDFLVFPEVFIDNEYFETELSNFRSKSRKAPTIICGVDYPGSLNTNRCFIKMPNLSAIEYTKTTRSQYDALASDSESGVLGRKPYSGFNYIKRGNELVRFTKPDGSGFGVLICYDYSHFDILWKLNFEKRRDALDFIVVISYNPYGDLYKACCVADAHRFYQYIVMCNVSTYGGSGVFGPIRNKGPRQIVTEVGMGAEALACCELDLAALRQARKTRDEELHTSKNFMRRPGIFQFRIREK